MTSKTVGVTCFGYGTGDAPLFRVEPGQDAILALDQASAMLQCVRRMTLLAATDGEADLGWAAHLLSDMAKAIMDDMEVGRQRAQPWAHHRISPLSHRTMHRHLIRETLWERARGWSGLETRRHGKGFALVRGASPLLPGWRGICHRSSFTGASTNRIMSF